MKIPIEIASIIVCLGNRQLTFSEKKELLVWYKKLESNSKLPTLEDRDEFAVIEDKILRNIMNYINRHPDQNKNK